VIDPSVARSKRHLDVIVESVKDDDTASEYQVSVAHSKKSHHSHVSGKSSKTKSSVSSKSKLSHSSNNKIHSNKSQASRAKSVPAIGHQQESERIENHSLPSGMVLAIETTVNHDVNKNSQAQISPGASTISTMPSRAPPRRSPRHLVDGASKYARLNEDDEQVQT
jgi:hypothetical protein